MTRILIALLAARVVTSFTGGAASIRPHRSELAAATMTKPEKSRLTEALPGIHLPGSSYEQDSSLISGGLGTITGMEKGRHVMACKKVPFAFPICRGKLQKVLDTYNGYSKRLKKAYTAKLKKLPDFSTLGYIYSDWAKDGFDGKQLTVTTYI